MTMPKSPTSPAAVHNVPSVFVACLGCWNAGRTVGGWFQADTCPQTSDDLAATGVFLPFLHFLEGHEELWCFDLDGFDEVQTAECSPAHALRVAELISEADERGIPREALAYWVQDGHDDADISVLLDELQDAFCGEYDDGPAYAAQLADELGLVPDGMTWPLTCIDWEHAWRELEIGGDNYAYRSANGTYLVFRAI